MAEELRELNDIPGFDSRPSIDPETASELDRLVLAKEKEKETPTPEPEEKSTPEPEETPVPEPEEKKSTPDDDKKSTPDDDKKPAPTPAPEEKAEPEDDFTKVVLPPYTKPKTVESFDIVKRLAREKVSAAEKERDELKKQNGELSAKAASGMTPEVEKELKELREFRSRMDVEADPQFKTYDEEVTKNIESIYSRLKAAGMSDAKIEEIKKLGGPAEVDWDAHRGDLPGPLRRFIDQRLGENEGLADKKNRALTDAKKNATEYLRAKQESDSSTREQATKQTEKAIQELIPKLGWMEPRKAKAEASEAEKTVIAQHNKLVEESNEFLKDSVSDDSPEMRGTLALAYVQLQKLRSDYGLLKMAKDAKIAELTEELKEAKTVLDKVKRASTSRLKNNSVPKEGDDKPANLDVHGSEALDSLLKASRTSQ